MKQLMIGNSVIEMYTHFIRDFKLSDYNIKRICVISIKL